MKKICNERFQEVYYEDVLENGLKVVLWEKKGFMKNFFLIATPLGAFDLIQVNENGEDICFPNGIAHFLEHKMFEKENKDVMEEFTRMGANCNAFTSFNETMYYFSTTEDPIQPLGLLLDFVQELCISDESVEKEKGIIIQELEMYHQMSESRILNETMEALFHHHPLKYDIGGSKESVSLTTKKQLEEAYLLNYHPSKMILVGVSGHDCKKIMNYIIENQKKKKFRNVQKVTRKKILEPKEVKEREKNIYMDVSIPKVCLALKCFGIRDPRVRNRTEWIYKILLDLYFSSMNPKFQSWIDEEIINQSFSFEIDFGEDYGYILFYSETYKKDIFISTIFNTLKEIENINEETLEQLKRRYYGNSIMALQNMKQIAVTYARSYFANQDFFESIEDLESISSDELLDSLHKLNLNNYSVVQILPNKN